MLGIETLLYVLPVISLNLVGFRRQFAEASRSARNRIDREACAGKLQRWTRSQQHHPDTGSRFMPAFSIRAYIRIPNIGVMYTGNCSSYRAFCQFVDRVQVKDNIKDLERLSEKNQQGLSTRLANGSEAESAAAA